MDQYQVKTTGTSASQSNSSLLDSSYLQHLPSSNPGLIAIIRFKDTKILFVNEQFEHYLGYSNKDLENEGVYFSRLLENY